MSSRRRGSGISDDEINDLVNKLQALLPHSSSSSRKRPPSAKVVKEACKYIRKLHVEVDNLTERLSQILESMETNSDDAVETLRSLLQQ